MIRSSRGSHFNGVSSTELGGSLWKMCFVCGRDNPYGLKLDISARDGQASTEFIAGELYQGYNGIWHGGIIAAVLDELMIYAALSAGYENPVTAKLEVRYLKPIKVGQKVKGFAELESARADWLNLSAKLMSEKVILAEARGLVKAIS